MTLEQQRDEAIARAERYTEALRDGMVNDALNAVERQLTEALVEAETPADRDFYWLSIRNLRKLRQFIGQAIASGRLAENHVRALRSAEAER